MHNLEMLPLARSPKRDRFGDLSTHHQVGGGGIWQAVEAEPGASGWRRLDPLSSRLDLVGPLATATGSLRGAAPSPLQLHVTTEGLGSASSSSRPPPPGAGGVGWARCPQLAAPSDGGLLPPLSPSPPPHRLSMRAALGLGRHTWSYEGRRRSSTLQPPPAGVVRGGAGFGSPDVLLRAFWLPTRPLGCNKPLPLLPSALDIVPSSLPAPNLGLFHCSLVCWCYSPFKIFSFSACS